MKSEARQVAVLRHSKTGVLVGRLYLWDTGEAIPMWLNEEISNAIADPLPGECPHWAKWALGS